MLSFVPPSQLPRHAPPSLSLRSLGVATRVLFNEDLLPVFSEAMPIPALPSLFPSTETRHPRAVSPSGRPRAARAREAATPNQALERTGVAPEPPVAQLEVVRRFSALLTERTVLATF